MDFTFDTSQNKRKSTGSCTGWLMTAVAPWGETKEDAFDQCLVEIGLGDSRLIRVEGAMLPMGFEAVPPEDLPMGSLVECHIAESYTEDGGTASAGVAWAQCVTPEGDECSIVGTISTLMGYEETVVALKRSLKYKLSSRDLEVVSHEVAVDEVTAAEGHYGCATAALILPESLNLGNSEVGRVRGSLTRSLGSGGPPVGGSSSIGGSDFTF